MPGVLTLESDLGINRNTMQAALLLLEIYVPDTPPGLKIWASLA